MDEGSRGRRRAEACGGEGVGRVHLVRHLDLVGSFGPGLEEVADVVAQGGRENVYGSLQVAEHDAGAMDTASVSDQQGPPSMR